MNLLMQGQGGAGGAGATNSLFGGSAGATNSLFGGSSASADPMGLGSLFGGGASTTGAATGTPNPAAAYAAMAGRRPTNMGRGGGLGNLFLLRSMGIDTALELSMCMRMPILCSQMM